MNTYTQQPVLRRQERLRADRTRRQSEDLQVELTRQAESAAISRDLTRRGRAAQEELRRAHPEDFQEQGAEAAAPGERTARDMRGLAAAVAVMVWISAYTLDVLAFRQVSEFLVGVNTRSNLWAQTAVLAIPAAVITLETWIGWQFAEALRRREELDEGPRAARCPDRNNPGN
jgi:hypothetical protein